MKTMTILQLSLSGAALCLGTAALALTIVSITKEK